MLELEHIVGGYGTTTVLRDVSISVPAGTAVALLGPNGAGKSTTLRMASGLLRPDTGRIVFDGRDVTRMSAHSRAQLGICHIIEGRSIFPSLTVRENLILQTPRKASHTDVLDRTAEAFPALAGRARQVAGTLSGGEQQMLALMRAYLANPRVVLVDEASLGLAPLVVDRIFEFLATIAAAGVSLLVVEQYVSRALALGGTVYLLNHGRLVFNGPAAELDEDHIFEMYASEEASPGHLP